MLSDRLDRSAVLHNGDSIRMLRRRTGASADSDADAGTNRNSHHSGDRDTSPATFINNRAN